MSPSILYIGKASPRTTSGHRVAALRRLGCRVETIDELQLLPVISRSCSRLRHYTGYLFTQRRSLRLVNELLRERQFDVVWVDSGRWCGPRVAEWLRGHGRKMVLYNLDDPTDPQFLRKGKWEWLSLRKAIKYFDLCVAPRECSVAEYLALGAGDAMSLPQSYDEVAHHPDSTCMIDFAAFRHEVVFVGSRMEDRHEFVLELLSRGVPISIYGHGWYRCRGWGRLKQAYVGPRIENESYVAAIQRSKIAIGMLSRRNRDLHTTRSVEIPYMGGLLCAPRTDVHQRMYSEGSEAVFWDTPEECASLCHELLRDEELREGIRRAGMKRVRAMRVGNEDRLRAVLDALFAQEC